MTSIFEKLRAIEQSENPISEKAEALIEPLTVRMHLGQFTKATPEQIELLDALYAEIQAEATHVAV
jgi:hypothetical protein